MSERFVNIDRETPMLFPVDMRDWLPEDHLVYFIIEAIEQIGAAGFKVNRRCCRCEQYPPDMMLALLVYSYVYREVRLKDDRGGDGTKIHANAGKHKAVSCKRAGEIIENEEGEREGPEVFCRVYKDS